MGVCLNFDVKVHQSQPFCLLPPPPMNELQASGNKVHMAPSTYKPFLNKAFLLQSDQVHTPCAVLILPG